MICQKTGATIYLEELDCFVRGDAYQLGEWLLIRVNNRSRTREPVPIIHYNVGRMDRWFDDDESMHGTIIASEFNYYGHEGLAQ